MHPAFLALAAALLFGASTPFAHLLVGDISALLLAGLLYLGSGLGLGLVLLIRHAHTAARPQPRPIGIPQSDWPWLLAATGCGGAIGPALLMYGLAQTSSATASLLLNMEAVLTAGLAWIVFREPADRWVVLGMLAIVAGGLVLAWSPSHVTLSPGAALVLGACLAWAIDNNLTRKVATNDAMLIACLKGLLAGTVNTALALAVGAQLPTPFAIGSSLLLGFLGYGLSLTLFVASLRSLGTARTGAYFSIAPLLGVAISLLLWPELPNMRFWIAAALMTFGIWLHVRERHYHEHTHAEELEHTHQHRHDEHHQHAHAFKWTGEEPHMHSHAHEKLTHTHVHYPDVHHRHRHDR